MPGRGKDTDVSWYPWNSNPLSLSLSPSLSIFYNLTTNFLSLFLLFFSFSLFFISFIPLQLSKSSHNPSSSSCLIFFSKNFRQHPLVLHSFLHSSFSFWPQTKRKKERKQFLSESLRGLSKPGVWTKEKGYSLIFSLPLSLSFTHSLFLSFSFLFITNSMLLKQFQMSDIL